MRGGTLSRLKHWNSNSLEGFTLCSSWKMWRYFPYTYIWVMRQWTKPSSGRRAKKALFSFELFLHLRINLPSKPSDEVPELNPGRGEEDCSCASALIGRLTHLLQLISEWLHTPVQQIAAAFTDESSCNLIGCSWHQHPVSLVHLLMFRIKNLCYMYFWTFLSKH